MELPSFDEIDDDEDVCSCGDPWCALCNDFDEDDDWMIEDGEDEEDAEYWYDDYCDCEACEQERKELGLQ